MTDEEYKATKVTEAQRAVEAADAFVEKLLDHLSGARESVEAAEAELARVQATDYVWEESHEHVIAGVQ
jgi:multidrug resistance efflux pump